MAFNIGDIVVRKKLGHHLLVLHKRADENGYWNYYCLNFNADKYVYSYMPAALYKKVA
jgi:hypothetical protein